MNIEGRRRERIPRRSRVENGELRIEELPVPPGAPPEPTPEPIPSTDRERGTESREEPTEAERDRQPTDEHTPQPRPSEEEPRLPAPEPAPRAIETTRASPEQISAVRAAVIGASGVAAGAVVGGAAFLGLGLAASYAAPMVIGAGVAVGTLGAALAGLYVAGRLTTEAAGLLVDFAHDAVHGFRNRLTQMWNVFNIGL